VWAVFGCAAPRVLVQHLRAHNERGAQRMTGLWIACCSEAVLLLMLWLKVRDLEAAIKRSDTTARGAFKTPGKG
jgi:hypothetical protein